MPPHHSPGTHLSKLMTCTDLPPFGKVLEGTSEGLPLECHVLTWVKTLITTTVCLLARPHDCSPEQGSVSLSSLSSGGGGLSSEGLCKCDYSPHSDSGQDLLSLVSNWQLDMWQTGFLISAKPAWRSKSPECISHQLQFRFYQITRFKWTQMHI